MSELNAAVRPHFCPDCGYQVAEGQAFCVACGRQNVVDVSDAALAAGYPRRPTPVPAPRNPRLDAAVQPMPLTNAVPTQQRPVPVFPAQIPAPAVPVQGGGFVPLGPSEAPAAVVSALPHGWIPASFGQRLAARLLDAVAVGVISLLLFAWFAFVTAAVGATGRLSDGFLVGALLLILLLPTGVGLIYRIGSDVGRGRSLGRSAVGIRLVKLPPLPAEMALSPDNEAVRVGVGTVLGRLLVGGLGDSIFFLSSLSVLWHPQKRSWGDLASGTAVVVDDRGEKASAWRPPLWAAAFSALICVAVVVLNQAGPSLNLANRSNTSTFSSDDAGAGASGSSGAGSGPSGSTDPSGTSGSSGGAGSGGTGSSGSSGSSGTTVVPRKPVPPPTYNQADGNQYTVKEPILVRSGPSRSYSEVTGLSGGASVVIACQTHGEQVTGDSGASDLWDYIVYPRVGYVSDEYIYTGTTGTDQQVAPPCS